MTTSSEIPVQGVHGAGGPTLLAALLVVAVLGGEHAVGSLVVLVLAGACLAWGSAGERLPFNRTELVLGIVLAAAALLAAAQLLPLPSAWLGGEFRAALDADLGAAGAPPWRRWSLDPAGTMRGLTGLVMVAGTWMAARRLNDQGRERLILLVVALGAVMAGWGVAESLGKPDTTGADTTFANRNQFAAFMAMLLPFAVAVANDARARTPVHLLAASGAGLLVLGTFMTYSRAGSALVVGATATCVVLLLSRAGRSARRPWLSGLAFLGAAILILPLAFDKLAARWLSPAGDDLRWHMVELGVASARDLWPWGGGIGSFRWVYQGRELGQDLTHATHAAYAHNEMVQLAVEAGLAGVLLALAFVVVVAVGAIGAWRAGTGLTFARAAAISAVVPILHSLVDAPLRAPACAVLMGLVLAVLLRAQESGGTGAALASRAFR